VFATDRLLDPKRALQKSRRVAIKPRAHEPNPGQPPKKRRRYQPGEAALREIRRYQKSTTTLVPRPAFRSVVNELTHAIDPTLRMEESAMNALHEAVEANLVKFFDDMNQCVLHAKRVTISMYCSYARSGHADTSLGPRHLALSHEEFKESEDNGSGRLTQEFRGSSGRSGRTFLPAEIRS
jgi:histone H3/H4